MKKPLSFLILIASVVLIVGCNNDTISFSGESENWKGEYTANISENSTREDGEYIFRYKNTTSEPTFKNLEIVINDGELDLKEEVFKGTTKKMPTSCSGCAVTQKEVPIKVTIKWDKEKEESFELEPK